MRILMLGWELPPHNSGGLGVACLQLCKTLADSGADIEFLLPYEADHDINFMKVTAAVPQDVQKFKSGASAYQSYKYVVGDGGVEFQDVFDWQRQYEQAVGQIVISRSFDVIHAHDWLTFRAALRAKQLTGWPFVAHVHSIESDRAAGNHGNPMVKEIEALGLMMADVIVAVSEHTRQAIVRDYDIPADKIVVVHNSIDRMELAPLDADNAYHYLTAMRARGYKTVSNVGRLTIQKGLANLLLAAREVVQRIPKTIFLIVGSGEQYHELIQQAADLGIAKNVVFAGFQRGKQWRDAFGVADLFVMPSVSEPFGLTPLEAIHYGTPSVISRQSGVSEVLLNCLKVDFWDVNEMANNIVAVLQNQSLRDNLVANANRELERISWETSASKLTGLYSRLTDKVPV
jgi:glycogen(starch) synthase